MKSNLARRLIAKSYSSIPKNVILEPKNVFDKKMILEISHKDIMIFTKVKGNHGK